MSRGAILVIDDGSCTGGGRVVATFRDTEIGTNTTEAIVARRSRGRVTMHVVGTPAYERLAELIAIDEYRLEQSILRHGLVVPRFRPRLPPPPVPPIRTPWPPIRRPPGWACARRWRRKGTARQAALRRRRARRARARAAAR